MQLLFPSLVLLLASVAIAFFVFPRVAPLVLVIGSAMTFLLALYMHRSQFGVSEYERSTWQNNLKKYSSLILMAIVLLAAYGFYAMNQGGSAAANAAAPAAAAVVAANAAPAAAAAAAAVPAAAAATAATATAPAAAAGGGFKAVFRTVSHRLKSLFKNGRID